MCQQHSSLQHAEVCTALLGPESLLSAATQSRTWDLPGKASSHTENPRRCSSSIAMKAVVTDGSSMLPLRMTSLKLAILIRCICRQTLNDLRTAHLCTSTALMIHFHLMFHSPPAEHKSTDQSESTSVAVRSWLTVRG